MKNIILILVSIFFDLLIVNIYRITSFNLNIFYPMFTISMVSYISYNYNNANRKNYYFISLVSAIIYDTLAVNNLIITIVLFLFVAFFNIKAKRFLQNNLFSYIIKVLLSVIIFDMGFYIILVLFRYERLSVFYLFYKIYNSLLLNIIYTIMLFMVLRRRKA